jgi:hypothetical protein
VPSALLGALMHRDCEIGGECWTIPAMPNSLARALFGGYALAMCLLGVASAQTHDVPTTLPDDDFKLLHDDMPTTLPDDSPVPEAGAPPPIRFEASINAALSLPIARNPDVAGFGLFATYGVGWGEIPLALLDVTLMGMTQAAERLFNTRLMHFDAWLRVQPAHWAVRPYAEGFFGAQLLQAHWIMRAGNAQSELAQADAWTRNFGWGLGVEFLGLLSRTGDMSLTLGMRRVYGGTAKVSRSVAIAGERVPSHYEADTSVLLFTLGIGLHYDLAEPPPRNGIGN